MIVAGEASGDLYGGLLIREMVGAIPSSRVDRDRSLTAAERRVSVRFIGVGGPGMREAGLQPLGDASAMGVTGFLEVLRRLPAIWNAFRRAGALLHDPASRPDLAIFIDYPDFNLRLAHHARKVGVPVLYFVGPQVWAWRKGRLRTIAGRVDRMLVILPFEEAIYRGAGVPVTFVGHPLLDIVRAAATREQTLKPLGLDPRRRTVALLPGSRRNELESHLPPMMGAAHLLAEEFSDLQFVLPVSPTLSIGEVERLVQASGGATGPGTGPGRTRCVLVPSGRYDALQASDAAAVASGTATLETALLGVPMVIVYRMNSLTYALARLASHVEFIGMPNLIAGEKIVPELVQRECRPDRIAAELRRILTDTTVADEMRRGMARVRTRLGSPGAIGRVAAIAWDMIGTRRSARAG